MRHAGLAGKRRASQPRPSDKRGSGCRPDAIPRPGTRYQQRAGGLELVSGAQPICSILVKIIELSQEVFEAGRAVVSANGAEISVALNQTLNRFLGWPFRAGTGYATDREGTSSKHRTMIAGITMFLLVNAGP